MRLFNCKTSAPLRRKSGDNKEKMQGARRNLPPLRLGRPPPRPLFMKSNRATKSGLTAARLAAGSFDVRLAAGGKSGREQHRGAPPLQSAHRTTDSKNPPRGLLGLAYPQISGRLFAAVGDDLIADLCTLNEPSKTHSLNR